MREREIRIAKEYMKEHLRGVVIFGIITGVLFGLAGLYGYEGAVRNMSYGVFLIAFFGLCYGVRDYIRYRARCSALLHAGTREGEKEDYLPGPVSYPEKLYQNMIRDLEQENRRRISEYDEKKRDMADYYTMWTHQIKTPIAAMRLLLGEEDEALKELFKVEQYTEMALCYARLESLSSDLLFKRQDIYSIVKQAVKKYSVLFIGSGLSFSLEEFSCHAVTDEKWVGFVIEQILSNALKYTSAGGIRIRGESSREEGARGGAGEQKIQGDAQEEKGRRGHISQREALFVVIEDSGMGIRGEDLPRIFERGFTGYNGRLDKRSTGIGLYLCRQIMDRLSHTIEVESEAGKGTRVRLGFVQEPM